MRDLIRRCTTQRGHDPAEFALIAYGGAGPQFAGRFAAGLGVRGVVIPALAAGLSAFGALSSDLRVRTDADLRPAPVADAGAAVGELFRELEPGVRAQLAGAGHDEEIRISRSVALRYYRQIHRMDLTLDGPFDAAVATGEFRDRYESVVGAGSAPPDTPVEVVAVGVEALLPTYVADPPDRAPGTSSVFRRKRAVFDETETECPVYAWESLGAGQVVTGPAFVETRTTTAVVYPGQRVTVAGSGDLLLELGS
jgi:N-methylhydantoinase A